MVDNVKTTQPKVIDPTSKMFGEKTWSAHKWCRLKKHKLQSSIAYNSCIKLGATVNRFLSEKNQIPFALNGAQTSHTKMNKALEEW